MSHLAFQKPFQELRRASGKKNKTNKNKTKWKQMWCGRGEAFTRSVCLNISDFKTLTWLEVNGLNTDCLICCSGWREGCYAKQVKVARTEAFIIKECTVHVWTYCICMDYTLGLVKLRLRAHYDIYIHTHSISIKWFFYIY